MYIPISKVLASVAATATLLGRDIPTSSAYQYDSISSYYPTSSSSDTASVSAPAWSSSYSSQRTDLAETTSTFSHATSTSSSVSQPIATSSTPESSKSSRKSIEGPVYALYQDGWQGSTTSTTATGLPPVEEIKGFNVCILAFWKMEGAVDALKHFISASEDDRTSALRSYRDNGIKVLVSAFGAEYHPQDHYTAAEVASQLAQFVKQYDLDGTDLDYEDIPRFNAGNLVDWYIELNQELRKDKNLPFDDYIITNSPLAPWLSSKVGYPQTFGLVDKATGHLIDYYFVQFYNQYSYQTKELLMYDSAVAGRTQTPGSSLMQIIQDEGYDPKKLVIGKPWDPKYGNGFMEREDLGAAVKDEVAKGTWNTGFSFWQTPIDLVKLGQLKTSSGLQ